jgi:hypothetical protein
VAIAISLESVPPSTLVTAIRGKNKEVIANVT